MSIPEKRSANNPAAGKVSVLCNKTAEIAIDYFNLLDDSLSKETQLLDISFMEKAVVNLMETAGIGLWSFDIGTRQLHICPTTCKLMDIAGNGPIPLKMLARKLSSYQKRDLLKAIRDSGNDENRFAQEINLNSDKDVGVKWLKVIGKVYGNRRGLFRIVGTVRDVTNEKMESIRTRDLMAFLSHELRTPLTAIKLYVQRTSHQLSGKGFVMMEEMLGKADHQIISMTHLIENFLTLSLSDNSQLILTLSYFDICEVINEVLPVMKVLYPCCYFNFESDGPIWLTADRDKIIQVLNNYLTNAAKYSKHGSPVMVKCIFANDFVSVIVKDQGAGINKVDQHLLFTKYSRLCSSHSNAVKGYGLGLFLCKEIIERHHGRVWMESEPGMGSTFSFSLPA